MLSLTFPTQPPHPAEVSACPAEAGLRVFWCPSVLTHAGKQRPDLQFPLLQQTLLPELPLSKPEATLPDSLMESTGFCIFQDQCEHKLPLIKLWFITNLDVIMWFATKGHCLHLPMDSVHISFPGVRRPSLYPDYKDYTIYIKVYTVSIQTYARL